MTDERERLLALLQHVPVGLAQFRKDGTIESLNARGAAMLMSIAPSSSLTNLYKVISVFDSALASQLVLYPSPCGSVLQGRRLRVRDGRGEDRVFSVDVQKLGEDDFFAALSDVTEVERNERRVREALTNLERLLSTVAKLKLETHPLRMLLSSVLRQVMVWIGAESAMLLHCPRDGRLQKVAAFGDMQALVADTALLDDPSVRVMRVGEVLGNDAGRILLPLQDYAILADLKVPLDEEKLLLLQLFLDTAVQAIDNARMLERMAQQEKLSAVGEAVGGVVHDLRNPMTVISGASKLAIARHDDAAFVQRMLERVLGASEDAMALLNDILDYLKDASVSASRIEIASLLAAIAERQLQTCAKAGVVLEVGGGEGLHAHLDAHKIERAVMNLVGNAVEAMKGRDDGRVSLRASLEEGLLVIAVSDNGPGIPPQIRDTLFEPFTTYGKTGGTGLGLAIVKQIVMSHGGRIEVATRDGGTTFRISLPRETPAAP